MKGIMISWGAPIAGRERLALEEFASFMHWVTALKAQGKITDFEVYNLEWGDFETWSGFAILEGTAAQIDEVGHSDDFTARTQRTLSVIRALRIEPISVGEDVTKRMKAYGNGLLQLKL